MAYRITARHLGSYFLWILAIVAILGRVGLRRVHPEGWDLRVYCGAILALRAGHDPYADGIAVQRAFHATMALHPTAVTPFTYVYSPLTLPLLKWIGRFPLALSAVVYWVMYCVGLMAAIWVGMQAVEAKERYIFVHLAPFAAFFPGLLFHDVMYSGNVAYILYGAVFSAALLGWRRSEWLWFYLAVLVASCCKAPLLTLLAIPVLSARKQWLAAVATAVAGLAIFAVQPRIWPDLFRNYLTAVELQFSYNHDFGLSPAGLVADTFYDSVPYEVTTVAFYLVYAVPAVAVLLYLRRKFLSGAFSLEQWIPVLCVGTIFLNPRIMEYDVAPITPWMALIVWRFFMRGKVHAILKAGLYVLAFNAFALRDWRPTESIAIVSAFSCGCWTLFRQAVNARSGLATEAESHDISCRVKDA